LNNGGKFHELAVQMPEKYTGMIKMGDEMGESVCVN
jgi:hypothetical protein